MTSFELFMEDLGIDSTSHLRATGLLPLPSRRIIRTTARRLFLKKNMADYSLIISPTSHYTAEL